MPDKPNLPLSTLLLLVGDENLSFQTLDSDYISAHSGQRAASITFSTDPRKVTEMAARAIGGPEPAEMGLIVWLPRDKARAATKAFMERPTDLRSRVTELVGEASVLFGPAVGVEVFDSEKGKNIVDRILALIDPVSDDLTIRLSDLGGGILEMEGVRVSIADLKEMLRNPPPHLFSVKRSGNKLEFTTWHEGVVKMRGEFLAWLDTQTINRETIGTIRTSCFMPFDSDWNGFVRDETAAREKPME